MSAADTLDLQPTDGGVLLPVRAQPKAKREALAGVHDGRLRVQVTTAPEKGRANDAIVKLLAKSLGLKRSQVSLSSGATSPLKTFLVANEDAAALRIRVAAALEG